ncbi:MAG: PQQ-binding-like beta-propeller repeat protein [Gammaproteobacteria bacterium]
MRRSTVIAGILLNILLTTGHSGGIVPLAIAADDGPDYDSMRGREASGEAHPGAAIYREHCAECHSSNVPRAPDKSFLEMMPGDMILQSLTDGIMQPMSAGLTSEERSQVAEYLGGSLDGRSHPPLACKEGESGFDYNDPPFASGWGVDPENTRFIPASVARLPAEAIPQLELKWAFAYPGVNRARSQPAFAGGAVYVGSPDGTVYALDADTGCMRWSFRASAEVRTGITITPWRAGTKPDQPIMGYFADILARVYAVNLVTGERVWQVKVDEHPTATTTAQPVLYNGMIYQSVSSLEEAAAADPDYECCTFRGSVVAMNAATGEREWKSYMLENKPQLLKEHEGGRKSYGPAGAAVWNSPTVDTKRGLLYVGTSNDYTSPAQPTSDAIVALDVESGDIAWVRQTAEDDAWNVACFEFIEDRINCPEEDGPDVDYASPPMLVKDGRRDILVAGQKSGDVWGIDPDGGELLWHTRVGRGGNQGGINFGLAAGGTRVFVPVADFDDGMLPIEDARPGMYALDAFTGEYLWKKPADNVCEGRGEHCDPGISQAVTAVPGAVIAGHLDGRLRAYAAETGNILWEFDTWRDFDTLSGETARGGSFSGASGPMVVNGRLYANSGYGIYFHMPGNVLLVFGTPDK